MEEGMIDQPLSEVSGSAEVLENAAENIEQAAAVTGPTNVEEVAKEVGQGLKDTVTGFWDKVKAFFTGENLVKVITGLIVIAAIVIIFIAVKKVFEKKGKPKMSPHYGSLVGKLINYVFWIILALYVLSLFNVNLKAVWGAAGVFGLAIGFAAQTSVSNLISGLFVLGEKAMKIGDFIDVGGVSGVVDSIGLLSVKVHTLDNQMVRIPNSTIMNSNLTNFNSFDKRRLVFDVPVSYDTDLDLALKTIERVPGLCPTVLQDPAPAVFYDGYGDAINLKLAVWFKPADLIQTKNDVYKTIIHVCDQDGVEIPFTHYDVQIVKDNPKSTRKAGSAAWAKEAKKAAVTSKKVKAINVSEPEVKVSRRGRKPKAK